LLAGGNKSLVSKYLRSLVTKFEGQTGFRLDVLFGQMNTERDLIRAAEFVRGFELGDVRRLTNAIGISYRRIGISKWGPKEELSHAIMDMIGSITRLEHGGGHDFGYYYDRLPLLDDLPGGASKDGKRLSFIAENATSEAFANWFGIYSSGPGGRAFVRKFVPELTDVFEGILSSLDKTTFLGRLMGKEHGDG
jgi:hypothetical protein